MPVYDYACPKCGPFNDLQTVERAAEPLPCPHCGTEAPRIYATMPKISGLTAERREAHETNERSREAPLSVEGWLEAQAKRRHAQKGHVHGPGCGCGGSTSATTHKTRTLVRPDGSKSFPGARPWMISH